jgi:hypothetical protein
MNEGQAMPKGLAVIIIKREGIAPEVPTADVQ